MFKATTILFTAASATGSVLRDEDSLKALPRKLWGGCKHNSYYATRGGVAACEQNLSDLMQQQMNMNMDKFSGSSSDSSFNVGSGSEFGSGSDFGSSSGFGLSGFGGIRKLRGGSLPRKLWGGCKHNSYYASRGGVAACEQNLSDTLRASRNFMQQMQQQQQIQQQVQQQQKNLDGFGSGSSFGSSSGFGSSTGFGNSSPALGFSGFGGIRKLRRDSWDGLTPQQQQETHH